jgi:nucleoside-diphosphate-sugar epimerase
MSKPYTVLGATGALGSAVVNHLVAEGLPVRALARNIELAESMLPEDIEIVRFDAQDEDSLRAGCAGSAVLFNCLYMPTKLGTLAPRLRAIALEDGMRLLFPSNADVYGPPKQLPIPETHPLAPSSERGKNRVLIEQELMTPGPDGVQAVTLVRLPMLFGAHIQGSFTRLVFDNAMRAQKAYWLGSLDAEHNMCYLPDAAAVCVLLAMAEDSAGQTWHVSGGPPMTGRAFMTQVFEAFGNQPQMAARTRTAFTIAGALISDAKRMLEVMYQFEKPFTLDDSRFRARFPGFEYTPHSDGIADTVAWFNAEFGPKS